VGQADNTPALDRLQARLGHRFADSALLRTALTHSASSGPNNQRLEFLGDAVIGVAVSEHLFRTQPDWDEGAMSVARTRLVCQEHLAQLAQTLELAAILHVSPAVARSGSVHDRPSVLADVVEALFGALFIDAGYAIAQTTAVRLLVGTAPVTIGLPQKDAKTRLQEWLHARGWPVPTYRLVHSEGPDNAPVFQVECSAGKPLRTASGSAGSRKAAEQQAAAELLAHLETARPSTAATP
jgi:ribonuclease III